MREVGYFDNAAETKPLLHLWSLAIEEQFYIVCPALLWLAWRRHWNILVIVAMLLFVSFSWNIAIRTIDRSAVFFAPHTRAWELLAGVLLASFAVLKPRIESESPHRFLWSRFEPVIRETTSIVGLAMILFATVFLSSGRPFPGWWALLPVAGSAAIIFAGRQAILNRWLLASPAFVWLGLISYPLYLWHWPPLAFQRILSETGTVPWPDRVAAVSVAVVLAWVTYRFVELPIRFGLAAHRRQRNAVALVGSIAFGAIMGFVVFLADGVPQRPLGQVTAGISSAKFDWAYEATGFADGEITKLKQLPGETEDAVLFIGDSLVGQWYPRVAEAYRLVPRPRLTTIYASRDHCWPNPHSNILSHGSVSCRAYYDAAMALARRPEVHRIVLGGSWHFDTRGSALGRSANTLTRDIQALRSMRKEVVLIGVPPRLAIFDPSHVARPARLWSVGLSATFPTSLAIARRDVERHHLEISERLQKVATLSGASLVDPYDDLCPDNVCPYLENGVSLFTDANHVTASFARRRATFINKLLN